MQYVMNRFSALVARMARLRRQIAASRVITNPVEDGIQTSQAQGVRHWPRADEFPTLTREHLSNAQLFANRQDMVRALASRGGVVAEVGVALGEFSEFLMETTQPKQFVGIDTFQLHEIPELWGRSTVEHFQGRTHEEFYRRRMEPYGSRVLVVKGLSWKVLDGFPDAYFDLLYIDASHEYDDVRRDIQSGTRKVRNDGLVIFNDYTMYDHLTGSPYGVVQNVNELVANEGWRVVGFALQTHMFCDIAVRRAV